MKKKPPHRISPLGGFLLSQYKSIELFKKFITSLDTESYLPHHPTFQLLAFDPSSL